MTKTVPVIGSYVPDFELPGVDGSVHHLARYLEQFQAVCVIFMSNACPYMQAYLDRLKQLQTDLAPQRVRLVGINANDAEQVSEEGFEQMKQFAAQHHLNFPYLRDMTQEVALGFGAEKTPHAFLIDQTCVLRYAGAIDDNPHHPEAAQHHYLRQAILQLLDQQTILPSVTDPVGCALQWRS